MQKKSGQIAERESMKARRAGTLIIAFLLCLTACNTGEEKGSAQQDPGTGKATAFDPEKWKTREGEDYPYREGMVEEVLHSDSLRTLNEYEIIDLLGEPDRTNDGYLYYTVSQKRLIWWPLHTRTLVIKLAEDRTVEWIKLHE